MSTANTYRREPKERKGKRDFKTRILEAGWDTESMGGANETLFRAVQGGFKTPWRSSWQEVWEWLHKHVNI